MLLVALGSNWLSAATVTWDGGAGTGAWGTGTNWSTNSVPGNGDNLVFNAAAANSQYTITLGGTRTTLGMVFSSTGATGFTFTDSTTRSLTINGSGLVNNNANTQTFTNRISITVGATQNWNAASGDFSFAGTTTISNALTLSGANDFAFSGTTTIANTTGLTLTGSGTRTFSGTVVNSGGNRTFTNNGTGAVTLANVNLSNNNTGRTFTVAGTGNTSIAGTLANGGSGAGNLVKSGTGTLILSGTSSSYTGTTTVSQGTLQVNANAPSGSAGALGNATSAVVVNNASTGTNATGLLIGASGVTIGRNVTVANSGSGTTTLGGNFASGTGTFSGTVALNRSVSLNADGSSAITFSNTLSGAGGIAKTGTGTVVLSGANSFAGATTINAGVLNVRNATALGTTAGGTTVNSSGAALELQGGIAVGSEALALNGTGVSSGGALRNVSGNNSWAGNVTLATASSLVSAADTLTVSGGVSSTNQNLTIGGAGNITLSGTVGLGTGSVTKNDAGTLTLSGANTYSGGTTLNAGTLAVGNDSALGTGTLTANGGTLSATGAPRTLSNAVTAAGDFTIGGAQDLTLSGAIDLGGGTRTVTVSNSGTTTFSGVVGQPWYSSLAKDGAGRLVLSGANTFTGFVQVNAGTLALTNSNALGAAGTWNNVVANGATLELSNNINVVEGGFTVTGTGVGGVGAIRNLSGSNSLAGQIVLGGATTFTSTAGTLTLPSQVDVDSYALTLAGGGDYVFGNQIYGTGGSLNKTGAGTVTLSGANSYTGGTTIAAGTLVANNAVALGTAGNIAFTGGTLRYGTGVSTDYSARIVNGTGAIAVDTNGNNVTYAAALAGTNTGGLTKTGAGTLTLSAANAYTGATTVSAGTLNLQNASALGAGATATTVASGATLQLQGGISITGRDLNLGGTLQSVSGVNAWHDDIALTGNATILSSNAGQEFGVGKTDFSSVISMGSNTLTLGGSGDIRINSILGQSGDTGGVIKTGSGTVTFYGDRSYYTGTTDVRDGTLILDTLDDIYMPDVTILGDLVIGDGTGAANSAVVRFGDLASTNNKIVNTSNVTINADGLLDLNGRADRINSLTMTGGAVALGTTGTLTLYGNVTTNASAQTATISGNQFALSDSPSTIRTFTVADGAAASDLTIGAQVAFGGITKEGAGTMTLTGANIYGAATNVNAGVLNIQHGSALGATAGATTVANGAQLQVQGGIAVGNETLNLNGTGLGATGALRNISGDNSWAGPVVLASASRINSDAGTLTLNGTLTGVGHALGVGGSGNTTINGAIGTGNGTLNKDGSGTLVLAGNNTYSGVTTVTSGVLNIRSNDALGSTLAGTTVQSGAALQLQNGIAVGNEALSLSGTGVSNDGALRNISGSNTYGGAVTVASASTRINSDAGTLTLANTVALGSNTLTVGGAGNTTVSGQVTGASSSNLAKDGSGTLTLSNGSNTFAGNVAVTGGTLATGTDNALNSSSIDVTVGAGAELDLVAYAQTIGTLAGLGNVEFGSGGTLNLATGTSFFEGSFSGSGTIVVGAGVTLRLGADFYAPGVNITLAGGTLEVYGSTSEFGTLALTGNSIIDFAASLDSSILFSNVSLGSYSLAVAGWTNTQDFFLSTNNPGAQGVPPLNQISFGPSGGPPWTGDNTAWQSWDNQITPVPEPSTYGALLMGAGLALLGYRRWRRRRAAPVS